MSEKPKRDGVWKFAAPVRSYDVHIYFFQTDECSTKVAKELKHEIQENFPELEVYKIWEGPIGPHVTGMFEVDLKIPEHFANFVPWIQMNRRGLSVLVHPNSGNPLADHTTNAIWIGQRMVLNERFLTSEDDQYGYWKETTSGWVPTTPPST